MEIKIKILELSGNWKNKIKSKLTDENLKEEKQILKREIKAS